MNQFFRGNRIFVVFASIFIFAGCVTPATKFNYDQGNVSVSVRSDNNCLIYIEGRINQQMLMQFKNAIQYADDQKCLNNKVMIESLGGSIFSAMEIGKIIRHKKMTTSYFINCTSACVLIFMAGEKRTIGTVVDKGMGFSQLTNQSGNCITPSSIQNDSEEMGVIKQVQQYVRMMLPKHGADFYIDSTMETHCGSVKLVWPDKLFEVGFVTQINMPFGLPDKMYQGALPVSPLQKKDGTAAPDSQDVSSKLVNLKRLLDKGLISQKDYDLKKQELIKSM